MIGKIVHQLRAAGLTKEAAELKVAVGRARSGQIPSVSPETERAVAQTLRRSGPFAQERQDFRTHCLRRGLRLAA